MTQETVVQPAMLDELRRRERELADFIENASVGLHWIGPDGTILWANQAELDLLGYRREEYIGHNISEFHADREVIGDILVRLSNRETLHNYEAQLRCKDGTIRHVLISSNVLWEDDTFIHTRCFTRDITRRKEAEEQLARSEQRLALAQEAGHIGTFDWDIKTGALEWTKNLETLFGLSPGGFGGTFQNWREHLHPDDLIICEESIQLALERKLPEWVAEYRIFRADTKELRWIDARSRIFYDPSGAPVRMVGINIDVTEQKRLEETLRKQQEDYQTILDSVPAMIWYKDKENKHLRCNRKAAEFIGLAVAEVEGTSAADLFGPEDAERFYAEDLEVMISGRPKIGIVELLKAPSGDYRWHRTDKIPYFDRDGKIAGVVIVSADITEQKLSQLRLDTQYTITRILAEAATVEEATPKILRAVCESLGWDLGGLWMIHDNDEERLRCSGAWQSSSISDEMYGDLCSGHVLTWGVGLPGRVWASGEVIWIPDVTKEEDFPRARAAARAGLQSAFAFPIKTGSKIMGVMEFFSREVRDRQDEVIEMISTLGSQIGQFIERKDAEVQIKESEESYRTLAQTASDAIVTIDADSTILFANPAVEKIFGYTAEELAGREIGVLMPDYPRLLRETRRRLGKGGEKQLTWQGVELQGVRRDGVEVPLEISVGDFYKHGRHYFTCIIRDISDRKRAEQDRERILESEKQAREEAEEASRLKDEFLATLSHELRTPLTAVIGWTQMLRAGRMSESEAGRALEAIDRNARSQAQLIDDLLDVSRIITGKLRLEMHPLNPASFVQAAVEAVSPAAEAKGVHLATEIEPGAVSISGDATRLQQVIWNLLTNSIKFTPRGGRVKVRLRRVDDYVEISVSDTGVGIKPEFLPFVFDRFRQADGSTTRRHGGLGLGLSIVRHLLELQGGTITADSGGEGKGSIFTVTLPVMTTAAGGWRPARGAHQPSIKIDFPGEPLERLDNLRVLIVDDEDDTRELLHMALGKSGAWVETASTADEALALLIKEPPDILISDIGMPDEDGYELLRKVRALPAEGGGKTPAIALTAYARAEDRLRALRAGFQTHIAKPVDLAELLAVVAALAEKR